MKTRCTITGLVPLALGRGRLGQLDICFHEGMSEAVGAVFFPGVRPGGIEAVPDRNLKLLAVDQRRLRGGPTIIVLSLDILRNPLQIPVPHSMPQVEERQNRVLDLAIIHELHEGRDPRGVHVKVGRSHRYLMPHEGVGDAVCPNIHNRIHCILGCGQGNVAHFFEPEPQLLPISSQGHTKRMPITGRNDLQSAIQTVLL
mmetsp:Transcript_23302/g.57949  ORF Transcript_23302/g.57949 Transcript_23302/m.57949 type:complete len:200 (-) Transcript_23302:556-1155(-)